MNVRSAFVRLCYMAVTVASLALAGCRSSETRAKDAYAEYQAAVAGGDLVNARIALLRVVTAEDGVADYWLELGKLQVKLGAYSDAYYAFTRADELDRGNPQTLDALTQLALLSGELRIAEQYAKRLALVAPSDSAVRITAGYVALKRQNLDLAEENADKLLAALPLDPAATLLKARVLLARGMPAEAARLLEAQLTQKPEDLSSLKALIALRKRNGEWSKLASASARMGEAGTGNFNYTLLAIEAAFRAGEIEHAKRLSQRYLMPSAPSDKTGEVLQVWADRWKSPEAVERVRQLSRRASADQKLAYATFFNEAGASAEAAALLGSSPRLPISRANSSINAIIASSMALRGQAVPAKKILDAILEIESDHVYALRARANLEIRAGMAKAAISDAQRLVTISPSSARERLLLAKAYAVARDRRQMERALWDAFHEIPADHDLYEALRMHVQRTAGKEAAASVDKEFQQLQDKQLAREFF